MHICEKCEHENSGYINKRMKPILPASDYVTIHEIDPEAVVFEVQWGCKNCGEWNDYG